jgi:glutathione S-transferase
MALLELQVDFEFHHIELGKDNKTEWFRLLNPNETVPVIKHGDIVVYESLVVNEYLSEVFDQGKTNLFPQDPASRARARILISRCESKFIKIAYSYLSHKCNPTGENGSVDLEKDNYLRANLEAELNFLNSAITFCGGPYFLGDKISLVDISYIPFFERMSFALLHWKNFDIFNSERSHLTEWFDTVSSQSSYLQTRSSEDKIKEIYSRFLDIDYFQRVGVTQ